MPQKVWVTRSSGRGERRLQQVDELMERPEVGLVLRLGDRQLNPVVARDQGAIMMPWMKPTPSHRVTSVA